MAQKWSLQEAPGRRSMQGRLHKAQEAPQGLGGAKNVPGFQEGPKQTPKGPRRLQEGGSRKLRRPGF